MYNYSAIVWNSSLNCSIFVYILPVHFLLNSLKVVSWVSIKSFLFEYPLINCSNFAIFIKFIFFSSWFLNFQYNLFVVGGQQAANPDYSYYPETSQATSPRSRRHPDAFYRSGIDSYVTLTPSEKMRHKQGDSGNWCLINIYFRLCHVYRY